MAPGPQDVLSNVLAACKSDRAVTASFMLRAPWSLHSAGTEGVLIRICTGMPYWIQVPGQEPVRIDEHDIVMLPGGTPHTVSSAPAPATPAVPFGQLIETHMVGRHGDHPLVFAHGGNGPVTQLFSLHVWMPPASAGSLPGGLPPLIVLRQREMPLAATLAATMASLVRDSTTQRPGWQLSAARMADLVLVHILGEYLRLPASRRPGYRNALDDAGIARAITLMHDAPRQDWSVAVLASAVHMSRTVFSERFRALVGVAPMQYLGAYRMNLAADALKHGQARIADVAEAVGYSSEKAFCRAFQRWIGVSPSRYQHQHGGTDHVIAAR